jgi:hypothetical protein
MAPQTPQPEKPAKLASRAHRLGSGWRGHGSSIAPKRQDTRNAKSAKPLVRCRHSWGAPPGFGG